MVYTVLLSDGTVGEVDTHENPLDFEFLTVHLHDENGITIEVSGKPVEILEENL